MEPDLTDTIQTWRGMYGNHSRGPWMAEVERDGCAIPPVDRPRTRPGAAPGRFEAATMTQDGPRSDTLMVQLDDGRGWPGCRCRGRFLEVAGRPGPNASSAF